MISSNNLDYARMLLDRMKECHRRADCSECTYFDECDSNDLSKAIEDWFGRLINEVSTLTNSDDK